MPVPDDQVQRLQAVDDLRGVQARDGTALPKLTSAEVLRGVKPPVAS